MSTALRPRALPVAPDAGWWRDNVPCRMACPVHTDAGGYVAAVADGDVERAYAIARRNNPFPSICGRVCAAPCETRCRRGALDAPVAIRALKRYVTSQLGVESSVRDRLWRARVGVVLAETRGRVAIVGGGPAGLSCAHDLRLAGRAVTIFEREGVLGGMMRTGIPAFRLPRELLDAEIDAVLSLGVEVRLGVQIGTDVTLEQLTRDYDAVFLASGTGVGRTLDIPGRALAGVTTAVAFLHEANAGRHPLEAQHVVVIGGGSVAFDAARVAPREGANAANTAAEPNENEDVAASARNAVQSTFDAARTARRAGAREVTIISVESRTELAADTGELREAEREGVHLLPNRSVVRIVGNARVQGVELAVVQRAFTPDGRFAPTLDTSIPNETLRCDAVVFAVGQSADVSFVPASIVRNTLIAAEAGTQRTTHPRVWAGGDVSAGPRILIDAIADGQRAAASIDAALGGRTHQKSDAVIVHSAGAWHRLWSDYDATTRHPIPTTANNARFGADEVERTFAPTEAQAEAQRCLRCHANVTFRADRCIACALCVDVCPERCLSFATDGQSLAFSIDEARCIRCGLCVVRCPTEALTMIEVAYA